MPTVAELKAALDRRGLDVGGKKAELEARLAAWACLAPPPGTSTGSSGDDSGTSAWLRVGDPVVLCRGASSRAVARGSLKPAVPGTVVQVSTAPAAADELEEPYQVRGEGGRLYWYGRDDVQKAPDSILWPVKAEAAAAVAGAAAGGVGQAPAATAPPRRASAPAAGDGDVVVTKEVTAAQRAAAAKRSAIALDDDSVADQPSQQGPPASKRVAVDRSGGGGGGLELEVEGGCVYLACSELRCYSDSLGDEKAVLEFTERGVRLPLDEAWTLAEAEIPYDDIQSIEMGFHPARPFISLGFTQDSTRNWLLVKKGFVPKSCDEYHLSRLTIPVQRRAPMREVFDTIRSIQKASPASGLGCWAELLGEVPADRVDRCLEGLRHCRGVF
eukprot:SAG25_NODE_1413_length_3086_cov_3.809173_2_plen_386_part_00